VDTNFEEPGFPNVAEGRNGLMSDVKSFETALCGEGIMSVTAILQQLLLTAEVVRVFCALLYFPNTYAAPVECRFTGCGPGLLLQTVLPLIATELRSKRSPSRPMRSVWH